MKLAVIGIDGLSSKIALKYMDGIVSRAGLTRLQSIHPPITAPAWLSIATSLNPAKTGVIDFLNRRSPNSYKLEPVSSSDFKGRSVWDYASIGGYSVCVIDYPMVYPPYKVNGLMLPGFLSPKWVSYPEDLVNEIYVAKGDHWEHIYFALDKKYNDIYLFLSELIKETIKKIKWSLYVMDRYDCDLYIDVISHTDWLFHRAWHLLVDNIGDWNLSKDLVRERSRESSQLVSEFFNIINEYVSIVLERADNTLILSDHGFGKLNYVFNVANLLKRIRLTRFRLVNALLSKKGIISRIFWYVNPEYFEKTPFELKVDAFDTIDYDESVIYTLPHDELFMAIYIGEKYRLLRGKILYYIREVLENTSREYSNLSFNIIDVRETYSGPKRALLPDIIVGINDYSAYFEYKPFDHWLVKYGPLRRYTGTHRLYGVLMAGGIQVKKPRNPTGIPSILDITPTILRVLGLPIPDYIDGRVIEWLINTSSIVPRRGREYIKLKVYYNNLRRRILGV